LPIAGVAFGFLPLYHTARQKSAAPPRETKKEKDKNNFNV